MRRFFLFRLKKRRLLCAGLALLCLFAFLLCSGRSVPAKGRAAGARTAAESGGVTGRHLRFLAECGFTAEGPVTVETLRIPAAFNAVYADYNRLQLAQGFDLRPFAGRTVEKYVYEIEGGAAGNGLFANVLEADGRIVGGDVCDPSPNGCLRGFHGETDGYDQTG